MQIQQPTTHREGRELPIHKYKQQIINAIINNPVTIICGETGSGKTTQIPQFLYPYFPKILISQPRRISAITLAERVANQMKMSLGNQIGYNVRFQEKKCENTKVTFVTDGMAIRELLVGISYNIFILDEAHERSINTDVLMAILRKRLLNAGEHQKNKTSNSLNKKRNTQEANNRQNQSNFAYKQNFKLVIMSATIDAAKFMQYFNTDSLISIEGRSFPIDIYNIYQPIQNYQEGCLNTALQLHYENSVDLEGDILVFLTGEDEIVYLYKKLEKIIQDHHIHNLKIYMLYAALPYEYQHEIFQIPTPQQTPFRRIILATNIAETSVTIPRIKYVIDTGFMKVRNYDNTKLLDTLTIVPVSKANAMQRAGRAGREYPGKCYRLYLKNTFEEDLQDQIKPEILRSQLSGPILQLKALGIAKIKELQFLDQPSEKTLQQCLQILREIKCVTDLPGEEITEYGLEVSKIPLIPRWSHLLLASLKFNCQKLMLSMLSILSIENMFMSSSINQKGNQKTNLYEVLNKYLPTVNLHCHGEATNQNKFRTMNSGMMMDNFQHNKLLVSDHLAKINILHQYIRCNNQNVFCKQNLINKNNIKRAVLIRGQLQDYLNQIVQHRNQKSFPTFSQTHKPTPNSIKNMPNDKLGIIDQESVNSWLKCMEKESAYSTAKLNKDGKYEIFKTMQVANIHPESLCFYMKNKPQFVVFSQIVKTNKIYLKDVTPLQH